MEYCNDFKRDLRLGQETEKQYAELFNGRDIEIKDDSKHSARTGNVFIEYESRNKPSGIATTQADYWAIKTSEHSFITISTKKLKEIARSYIGTDRDILGGDNNTSKGVLIPRCELL